MPALDRTSSFLLIIDIQQKLMPAITGADRVIANASKLIAASAELAIPAIATEQYPQGLGATVPGLLHEGMPVLSKTTFDGTRSADISDELPADKRLVVAGCEAHVCVLQTVLGLLKSGREVVVVRDAIGSRVDENRVAACERMARHGAEMVTTEMAIFEWLGDARDPAFKPVMALIK